MQRRRHESGNRTSSAAKRLATAPEQEAGGCPRLHAVRTRFWGIPLSAVSSWRSFSLLKRSATFARQGGGLDCAQLRRALARKGARDALSDRSLRGSKRTKVACLQLPRRVGLVTSKEAGCRVGCFFVKKKDSMLRLVVDARWTNCMCGPPRCSRLAVASASPNFPLGSELRKWI